MLSSADRVARSLPSPLNVATGTPVVVGFSVAVGIAGNASCALSAGFEGPTSLRNGHLADAELMRDRTVAHPLALQGLDAAQTLPGDTPSAATPPFLSTKCGHPAVCITLLEAPNSAHRPAKRPRHVRLLGEARLHQEHNRIGLGDYVLGAIVMHRQSGDDDHALIRFDPQAAARIDDHGIGRRRRGQRQGMLGAHARSWSAAESSHSFKKFRLGDQENRTGIGSHPPHPRRAKILVISSVEASYVRSSEITLGAVCLASSERTSLWPPRLIRPTASFWRYCTLWCPIAQAPFHVSNVDALRSILGLAADQDPTLEYRYLLNGEHITAIVSTFDTFDPRQLDDNADLAIWLSRLPGVIETPYLVHTNYELPLLLDDRKKLRDSRMFIPVKKRSTARRHSTGGLPMASCIKR